MTGKPADRSTGENTGRAPRPFASPKGITLEYRLEEPVSLIDAPSHVHIERWTVTVVIDKSGSAEPHREIGYARLIVLNLETGVGVADLADPVSGDWVEITRLAERTKTATAVTDNEESAETSVMVLERLWIDPGYRGNGLGPIVAACAILRLGRGCRLVACYPAPFEPTQPYDNREHSIEALGRIWAKVGSKPWNDGVWMLDLHTTDLHEALAQLL